MRVELISQRMTAPTVFVRYQLNVINEPPPLCQLSLNHIHGRCVKSLQSEDKLPKHLIQWGRSHQAKLILLAFVPLEWGQSPWVTLQKNLKEIWSRNMSVDCGFTAIEAPIYASSWNMRNNLWLWVSYSIQLNALTKEKSIGRSSGAACDWAIVCQGSPNGHLCSVVIVVSVTAPLLVMAGIPSRRAVSDAGSKIFQDPPDGGCRKQPSLRSSDHRRHHQSPCPIKI